MSETIESGSSDNLTVVRELWNRSTGPARAFDVIKTNDNGYLVAGARTDDAFDNDGLILKFGPNGTLEWNQTIGGSNSERLYDATTTGSGNFLFVGRTGSYGSDGRDVWVLKLDSGGNELWNITYPGRGDDGVQESPNENFSSDRAYSITAGSDGGYLIAGYTDDPETNGSDGWVLKISSTGTELWNRTYGKDYNARFESIAPTADAGYIVAGERQQNGSTTSNDDGWLVKITQGGVEEWNQTYGAVDDERFERAIQTEGGNYLAIGVQSFNETARVWLVKAGPNGVEQWSQTTLPRGIGYDIINTGSNEYLLSAVSYEDYNETGGEAWLRRIDASGMPLWNYTAGGSDFETAESLLRVTNQTYVFAGRSDSYGPGDINAWVSKIKTGPPRRLIVDRSDPDAYDSIQAAIDDAKHGDTIEVGSGIYQERISINKNITLTSEKNATLDGSTLERPSTGITIGDSSAPVIEGLEIISFGTAINAQSTVRGWELRDVYVSETESSSIEASNTKGNWKIINSTIQNSSSNGVTAERAEGDLIIRNTRIWSNEGSGISGYESTGDWLIKDSTISNNQYGISADSATGKWKINRSTISDNSQDGLSETGSGSDWIILNSTLENNAIALSEASFDIYDSKIYNSNLYPSGQTESWSIQNSSIVKSVISGSIDMAQGDATRNWWGQPEGPVNGPGPQCEGNVNCSNWLTSPPDSHLEGYSLTETRTEVNRNTRVTATLENGETTSESTTITLYVDGTAKQNKTVTIPAEATKGIEFNLSFNTTGSRDIRVGLFQSRTLEVVEDLPEINLESTITTPGSTINTTLDTTASSVNQYEANITFDPDIVQVNTVGGSSDFDSALAQMDNTNGWVAFTQSRSSGVSQPDLATIEFDVVADNATTTQIDLLESGTSVCCNSDGDPFVVTYEPGTVTTRLVTINDYEVSATNVGVNQSTTVTASVENTQDTQTEKDVTLYTDGTAARINTVTIPANSVATVNFSTSFDTPGTHNVSVGELAPTAVNAKYLLSLGNATIAPDESVNLTLDTNAKNVSEYTARIEFDPSVVEVQSVSGTDDFGSPFTSIDNENGYVEITQSRSDSVDQAELAVLTFKSVGDAERTVPIQIGSSTGLEDSAGNVIDHILSEGRILVQYPTSNYTVAVDPGDADDYQTIQAAIDNVSDEATVVVTSNVYRESIRINNNITIIAPNGAKLNGSGIERSGFRIREHASPVIGGFTIEKYGDIGISARSGGDWVLHNLSIINNKDSGVSASGSNSDWEIRDTIISDNFGHGIVAGQTTGSYNLINITVTGNENSGISAYRMEGGNPIILNSNISNNYHGVRPYQLRDGYLQIHNSIITDNDRDGISATQAEVTIDATGNWWGQPEGPAVNQCAGNVKCSNNLVAPPGSNQSVYLVEYTPSDSAIELGQPSIFNATIKNFKSNSTTRNLTLYDNDTAERTTLVTIPARSERTLTFNLTFDSAGTQTLQLGDFSPTTIDVVRPTVPLNLTANTTSVTSGGAIEVSLRRADTGQLTNGTLSVDGRSFTTEDGMLTVPFSEAGSFRATVEKANTSKATFQTDELNTTVLDDSTTSAIIPFEDTSSLSPGQTPPSLAGKIRTETPVATETAVELLRDSSTNYSLAITAPDVATNVTIYLQGGAISASQNLEDLNMYLDGEQHAFEVNESAGPGGSSWVAFNIPHFSTRTVTFSADTSSPDLTVNDVGWNPSSPTEGDDVSFSVDIENQGDADATDFGVEIAVAGDVLRTDSIDLTAGNSTTVTVSSWSSIEGSYNVTAQVDDSNAVNESDETNNQYSRTISVESANQPPSADAGSNQTVDEGSSVTLDGTGSSDPDADSLSYSWSQTGGPSVTLSDSGTTTPSFRAPEVQTPEIITFELSVSDPDGESDTDTVSITVEPVNDPPTADAGSDQTVDEQDSVTLDGTISSDPDDDSLSYSWSQIGGMSVTLSDSDTATPSFRAPEVQTSEVLTFELSVNDPDGASNTDTVSITIEPVNDPPTADAGSNQTVDEGSSVTLDGTTSSDPDNDSLSYSWSQIGGQSVSLSGSDTGTASFTAPEIDTTTTLIFELSVTDGNGGADTATISVTIEPTNDLPTADAGSNQTIAEDSLITLDGTGSSDPDGDSLSYLWTQTGGFGVSLSDSETPTPDFTAPEINTTETLTFEITVSDGNGGSDTDTVSITVEPTNDSITNQPPAADFTIAPTEPTVGENVVLLGAASFDPDGSVTSYEWDLDGDGQYDDDTAIEQFTTFDSPGQKTVGLRVTDNDSAIDTVRKTLTVLAPANFSVSGLSAPASAVQGETITVNATVSNVGGGQGTTDVEFVFAGDVLLNQTVVLDAGNSTPVNFAVPTDGLGLGTYEHGVQAGGGSQFADITIEGSGGDGQTAVSLSPDSTQVDVSSTTTFDIVVESADGGVGAQTTTVTVENSSVAEITDIQLAGSPGLSDVSRAGDNSSVSIEAGLIDTADTGTVTIASITVEGLANGTTSLNLSVTALGDETGADYTLTDINDATLSVTDAGEQVNDSPTSTIVPFEDTSSLSQAQTTPNSLGGKIRAGTPVASQTSVELLQDSSTNYSLAITAPDVATNVTIYLQAEAISASQNLEDLNMYLDGEQHPFEVNESAGPGGSSWVAFNVPHFSTRTVTFTADTSPPDLTITDVGWSPSSPIEGDDVSFAVDIENQGDADATGFGVEVAVAGDVLSTDSIDLAAGNSTTVTLSLWSAVDGTYNVTAEVDDSNAVNESDETNNQYSRMISVGTANQLPSADAGSSRTVQAGDSVDLDGTGSFDPDNDSLSYSWSQIGGMSVTLNGSDTATPGFTAPEVQSSEVITFELSVSDTDGASDTDTVSVTIEPEGPPVGQSHDVTVTMNNVGASAWEVTGVDGNEDVASTGVENPGLTLQVGTRYLFENNGWSSHPLAFRDANGNPLLTQAGTGSFEDDGDVNFIDNGDTVAFTLTQSLAGELDDYICTVHSAMNGTVETEQAPAAAVSFSAQSSDGTSVTVDSVRMDDGGFVTMHDSSLLDGDAVGSVVGVSEYLAPGSYDNVVINLDSKLTADQTLIAMPHRDTNDNEQYDFVDTSGGEDPPYTDSDGAITDAAEATVQAGAPDFVTSQSLNASTVRPGDTIAQTVTIENASADASSLISIAEVPSGWAVEITAASPSQSGTGSDPATVSWSGDPDSSLWTPSETTFTAEFAVTVPIGAADGQYTIGSNANYDNGTTVWYNQSTTITVEPTNEPPTADAGLDQTVDERDSVTLNGTTSSDPDDDSLSYSWFQTGGTSVTLNDSSIATPSFTAPEVQTSEVITFELSVSDPDGASDTETVSIAVEPVNDPPTANAGSDQAIDEGSSVTLDGTASSDPDGDSLSHSWSQIGGQSVSLSGPDTETASFTAPDVDTTETLTFELTVSDGNSGTNTDTISITVEPVNDPPTADAGSDQTVQGRDQVTLDGSGSSDPDSESLSYSWEVVSETGPNVTIYNPESATPTILAPTVEAQTTIELRLIVTDPDGASDSDTVELTITPNTTATQTATPTATPGETQTPEPPITTTPQVTPGETPTPGPPTTATPPAPVAEQETTQVNGSDAQFQNVSVAEIEFAENASTTNGTVEVTELAELPESADTEVTSNESVVQALEIDVPEPVEDVNSTLRVEVSRASLDGADPQSLEVAHWSGGEWEFLETSMVSANASVVVLRGQTTGFSVFAVVASNNIAPPATEGAGQSGIGGIPPMFAIGAIFIIGLGGAVWWVRRDNDDEDVPETPATPGDGSSPAPSPSGDVADRPQEHHVPDEIPGVGAASVEYDALTDRESIGGGGNADVTKATYSGADVDHALAIKEPRMAGTLRTEQAEGLLEEAETWDKLDEHDHVVGVVDYGSEPIPWIAMEYMDGDHLGERSGTMDTRQALWTALAATEGVYHAHRRGIAHLDLKPQNILFRTVEDAWDVPKVADWGLSKHLLEHSKSVEGMSVEYAAPEQFDDDYGQPDDITDIYQLGAAFYELFTGDPPFEGQLFEVVEMVKTDRPTPPSELADVPDGLDEILLTALAKEKDDRYDDIVYLRDDLKELFDNY
jgi:PGF-pre-PGF domain-containing protein